MQKFLEKPGLVWPALSVLFAASGLEETGADFRRRVLEIAAQRFLEYGCAQVIKGDASEKFYLQHPCSRKL